MRFGLPAPRRGRACQRVVVVVGLVDGPALKPPLVELLPPLVEPGPPMELVLPAVSLLLVEPGVVLPPLGPPIALLPVEPGVVPPLLLPPMALLPPVPLLPGVLLVLLEVDVSGAGLVVVVDELDEDVVGVPSRLVQAPSETAAMSASAAHEVRDAFIRKLLEGCSKVATGSRDHPKGTLGTPHARIVGSGRRCM